MFGFMIYAAIAAGAASLPERILQSITRPFAQLSTTISTWTEDKLDMLVNAEKYKRENEELREKISQLNERNINIDELEIYNSTLQEMLGIHIENPDFEWAPKTCTIIARNANDIFGGFRINRGSDDGLAVYDLVLTSIGVVGIITEVAPNYAKVSTNLSKEFEVGVMTTRAHITGVIQNDIIYAKDGLCQISFIEKNSDIKPGDIVVTIGTDLYPANQIIGEVVAVFDDPNGLSMHALVKPSEDVFRLTNVLVVTGFDGKNENLN